MLSSSYTAPHIPDMKSSKATNSTFLPSHSSSIASPQFTYGTSVTTLPPTKCFSSLSPSFTPFFPQSKQKHLFANADLETGTGSDEAYDVDTSHSNYHAYAAQSVHSSGFSNYTEYTDADANYKIPWTFQDYYGVQSYDPWGSHGGWQEFPPTSDYLDNNHWGEPSSVEYLYANACTGGLNSSSFFPSDLLSYPAESVLSEEEARTSLRSRVCLQLPASRASSPIIPRQAVSAPSNSALSTKADGQGDFFGSPQNNNSWMVNLSKAKMEKPGTFVQESQVSWKNDSDQRISNREKEEVTVNGFGNSEQNRRNCESNGKQVTILQEGQSSREPSSLGRTCIVPVSVPGHNVATFRQEDWSQPKQVQLKQESGDLNLEKGSEEKGERSLLAGQNPSLHVSSELQQTVAEDQTLIPPKMLSQCSESISGQIVQGGSEMKNCLSVQSQPSSPDGCAIGSVSCTAAEHMTAKLSGLCPIEPSELDERIQTISINKAEIPLAMTSKQNLGQEIIADGDDDDQEAETYKGSDCFLDLSCAERGCSTNSSPSKLVPSLDGCQLLISSIYNLANVLATNQFAEYSKGSGHMDSQVLAKTISNLSYCLLQQSSEKLLQGYKKTSINDQLLDNVSILDPGMEGKGPWQDAPSKSSLGSSLNAECSTDATLSSEQMVHESFESLPVGTAQGFFDTMQTSSVKGCRPAFAHEYLTVPNKSAVVGCKNKATNSPCSKKIHVNTSCSPLKSISHTEKKIHCKHSCDADKLSLLNDKKGFCDGKLSIDGFQTSNASKCFSDLSQDKVDLDDGLPSKTSRALNQGQDKVDLDDGLPSKNSLASNRGHLLTSSMSNLSRVLLKSQSVNCCDGSKLVDLDALEKTICYLSFCLLRRSSDNLQSLKPAVSAQSIQQSCIVNAEQELHEKGAGKDASCPDSFVSRENFQPNQDSTWGCQEMVPECIEPISAEIARAASDRLDTPSIKSSDQFASACFRVSKNVTGVIGCGLSDHDDPKHSGPLASVSSSVAASDLEKNNSCKSFTDGAKNLLASELQKGYNDGANLNDVWNGHSSERSKCDLTLSHPDHINVKVVPSLNVCQMLTSSMHNLSKVLFSCQNIEHPNGFSYMDLDAMESSLSLLSDCLLKQSSGFFGKTHREPIDKTPQNCQEQLLGQKSVGQTDSRKGSAAWPYSQECSINDAMFMESSQKNTNQRKFLPLETVLPACRSGKGPLVTRSKTNRKVAGSKKRAEEAAKAFFVKQMEKPLEKVFELQDKLLKLQDDIAYERSESNSVLSTYKNLWREAHEALCHSQLEITEINNELEGLKQLFRKHKNAGSTQPGSKGLDPESINTERVSSPGTQEVMSRSLLLQAREACSNSDNKGETACSSLIDVDEGVAQRLSLLLARQSFDLNGFGIVDCSDSCVSQEMLDKATMKCHGSSDGWMQVEGTGSISQHHVKGQSELQHSMLNMHCNTYQQEETERILLKPSGTETCLEGDADWEHVPTSVM